MDKEQIKKNIFGEYFANTKKSKTHFDQACEYIPGGISRLATFFPPYPFFVSRGEGCRIYDLDGNEYIDFLNNYTAGVLGHNHPKVVDAAVSQLQNINSTAPEQNQFKLAKILCERIPGMESIRFCCSGTEAAMYAMQIARFFTGKNNFIKIDGGYHGGSDFAEVNSMPDLSPGDAVKPVSTHGISESAVKEVFSAPFNNIEAMEELLKTHKDTIAAIIMEPMPGRGGFIMPQEGYLRRVRALADKYEVLLILDEIITFRLHKGGLQTMLDVKPDLTLLGKIIGGGLPVGAVGGKKEIIEISDPLKRSMDKLLILSGTFSAHPTTMGAGLACMEIYDEPEINRLNGLGERLRKGLETAMDDAGLQGKCNGYGSLIRPVFSGGEANTVKDVVMAAMQTNEFFTLLHMDILNQGLFFSPRGVIALSTPMTEAEIDLFINAFGNSIEKVKTVFNN